MKAKGTVADRRATSHDRVPKRYLRALMAVARLPSGREYAVIYFSSGTFFRTDWLGAVAVRKLIQGWPDVEAMELVERMEAGAGDRARRLIDVLDLWKAMSGVQPVVPHHRRLAAQAIGVVLSCFGFVARVAPTAVLARAAVRLPATSIADRVWRSTLLTILNNLRAGGYAGMSQRELLGLGRRCAAAPSCNYVFMYLSRVLGQDRLSRLVDHMVDRGSADDLAARLESDGPTIGVFLHGPMCVGVPNALRSRGRNVARAVVPWTHGLNVGEGSGPLRGFFGESPDMAVAVTDSLASGALLRHLKSGSSVYLALDEPMRGRKPDEAIEMLGQPFPRNDGPAWLAVRSGRPLSLWTTYTADSKVVINASRLLYPDPALAIEQRVDDLSKRLYACAEAAIRANPEAWGRGWVVWGPRIVHRRVRAPQPHAGGASTQLNA